MASVPVVSFDEICEMTMISFDDPPVGLPLEFGHTKQARPHLLRGAAGGGAMDDSEFGPDERDGEKSATSSYEDGDRSLQDVAPRCAVQLTVSELILINIVNADIIQVVPLNDVHAVEHAQHLVTVRTNYGSYIISTNGNFRKAATMAHLIQLRARLANPAVGAEKSPGASHSPLRRVAVGGDTSRTSVDGAASLIVSQHIHLNSQRGERGIVATTRSNPDGSSLVLPTRVSYANAKKALDAIITGEPGDDIPLQTIEGGSPSRTISRGQPHPVGSVPDPSKLDTTRRHPSHPAEYFTNQTKSGDTADLDDGASSLGGSVSTLGGAGGARAARLMEEIADLREQLSNVTDKLTQSQAEIQMQKRMIAAQQPLDAVNRSVVDFDAILHPTVQTASLHNESRVKRRVRFGAEED